MAEFHDLNINKNAYINGEIKVGETEEDTQITKEVVSTKTLKGNITTDYFQQGEEELIFDSGDSSDFK